MQVQVQKLFRPATRTRLIYLPLHEKRTLRALVSIAPAKIHSNSSVENCCIFSNERFSRVVCRPTASICTSLVSRLYYLTQTHLRGYFVFLVVFLSVTDDILSISGAACTSPAFSSILPNLYYMLYIYIFIFNIIFL